MLSFETVWFLLDYVEADTEIFDFRQMNNSPKEIFVRNRTKFATLYVAVKANHEAIIASGRSTIGHDFYHSLVVAQYSAIISETDRNAEMVWVAALMHNTDRHYSSSEAGQVIDGYKKLITCAFSNDEIDIIEDAVHKHSKKNDDSDSEVLKALKDGDRLANSGPINVFRCALYNHDKPAFLIEELSLIHPSKGSTFKDPRSCYDAFFFNEEWRAWLRMPKAIKIGQAYFDYLQAHQRAITQQLEDVGLYPWGVE